MMIELLGRKVHCYEISAEAMTKLSGDPTAIGFWDGETIFTLKTLSPERRKRVVTHEVVHAVLSISGLSNLLEDELEEAICDAMETINVSNL